MDAGEIEIALRIWRLVNAFWTKVVRFSEQTGPNTRSAVDILHPVTHVTAGGIIWEGRFLVWCEVRSDLLHGSQIKVIFCPCARLWVCEAEWNRNLGLLSFHFPIQRTSLDWQVHFISGGLGVFGKDKHYLASGNSRAVSTGSFKWLK